MITKVKVVDVDYFRRYLPGNWYLPHPGDVISESLHLMLKQENVRETVMYTLSDYPLTLAILVRQSRKCNEDFLYTVLIHDRKSRYLEIKNYWKHGQSLNFDREPLALYNFSHEVGLQLYAAIERSVKMGMVDREMFRKSYLDIHDVSLRDTDYGKMLVLIQWYWEPHRGNRYIRRYIPLDLTEEELTVLKLVLLC